IESIYCTLIHDKYESATNLDEMVLNGPAFVHYLSMGY
ncbi:hypothetical protein ACHAXN_011894, partial [Cyclotella atomus]